jgi:hypothetical protein
VEDADFIEEKDRNATCFALADFRTKANQKRSDVLPGNVCTGGVGEHRFDGLLMRTPHRALVPQHGTARTGRVF